MSFIDTKEIKIKQEWEDQQNKLPLDSKKLRPKNEEEPERGDIEDYQPLRITFFVLLRPLWLADVAFVYLIPEIVSLLGKTQERVWTTEN